MKTLLKNSGIILGLTGTLFAGCKKGPGDIVNKGFDVDLFSKNMTASCEGKTVGYAFAIAKDGKIVKYGQGDVARQAIDAPEKEYVITTRQDIASCSKTITALAVLKALEDKGKNENVYLFDYLPPSWNIPLVNRKITVAQLLAHKTGLTKYGGLYVDVRKTMQTPSTGYGDDASFKSYNNVNYAICRVLVACIVNGKAAYEGLPDDAAAELTAQFYRSYVREKIFKVAGLPDYAKINVGPWNNAGPISPKAPDRNMTLHYNFSVPGLKGVTPWASYLSAGVGGWYMNAAEVAQVLLTAEANKVVSGGMMKRMKEKLMGFDSRVLGEHGSYYWKNGGWSDDQKRGLSTYIMHFPNNVQIAWHTNSVKTTIGNTRDMIANAYDNAWR